LPVDRDKHVTMHTLRHTCAMNLLAAGVDITVIALWLGHEQTSTTEIYLHADMETKKTALEKTRSPEVLPGTYTPNPGILTWLEALYWASYDFFASRHFEWLRGIQPTRADSVQSRTMCGTTAALA